MLPNKEEGAVLLDFYGDLLTNHQQEVLIEYYNEDLSMNEIAENSKVSKAAISDLIKRSTNQLLEYEKKLGDSGFFRCQKSYLINLEKVKEMFLWKNPC